MSKYKGHEYRWSKPFGSVHHNWELRTVHGGINFHISLTDGYEPSCGLELHIIYPKGGNAPDHVNCPLTGGRCWHTGTSLYAREWLWPLIEPYLKTGDHEKIFRILEKESEKLSEYSPTPEGKERNELPDQSAAKGE